MRYGRRRDRRLRDRIVESQRPLVEAMARRLAQRLPASVDVQDLVHAGIGGLLQALDKYDPQRGHDFSGFMRPRVRGAMLDELRHMDDMPRLYRSRRRAVEEARESLRGRLDREPSDAELAAELGVDERHVRLQVPRWTRLPGNGTTGDRDAEDERILSGLDALVADEDGSPFDALHQQELLEKIREQLQPLEWKVLRLHYLEGLTGKEVARRLQLSASRICQIHVRVLSRLKARLRSAGA